LTALVVLRILPVLQRLGDAYGWFLVGEFLRPVFSASHVQHISDLHSKLALRLHHVWKYGNIESGSAENRREKKTEERRKKPLRQNIMACLQVGHKWLTNKRYYEATSE